MLNVPEVTDCVQVHRDLHVKLFYKGSPLPLPQWFHHGRDCRLTRRSMMQNLPNYIKLEGEQTFNILEELKKLKFIKKEYCRPILFDIHFFYVYNSLQAYQLLMKEVPFPSLSLLKKSLRDNLML